MGVIVVLHNGFPLLAWHSATRLRKSCGMRHNCRGSVAHVVMTTRRSASQGCSLKHGRQLYRLASPHGENHEIPEHERSFEAGAHGRKVCQDLVQGQHFLLQPKLQTSSEVYGRCHLHTDKSLRILLMEIRSREQETEGTQQMEHNLFDKQVAGTVSANSNITLTQSHGYTDNTVAKNDRGLTNQVSQGEVEFLLALNDVVLKHLTISFRQDGDIKSRKTAPAIS